MAMPTLEKPRDCSLLTPTNASHLLYLFLSHIYSKFFLILHSHTHTAPSVLPSRLPEVTISEEELMIIAERIPREWQRLGIALGIQYSVLESIRRKHSSDTLAASMEMFATWQRLKGDKATRIALKEALNFLNYGRLVQELFEKD